MPAIAFSKVLLPLHFLLQNNPQSVNSVFLPAFLCTSDPAVCAHPEWTALATESKLDLLTMRKANE